MAKEEAPGTTLKPERVQKRLTVAQAGKRVESLPDWELASDGRSISRTIHLPSLALTAVLLNLVAALAELSQITPELELRDGNLTLRFGSTRDGLYPRDFGFAETLEGAASLGRLGGPPAGS